MLPILFQLGPFTIKTAALIALLSWLMMGFVFWRRGREEHYREDLLFDQFILASIFGLILGRVGFILLHPQVFGINANAWLDLGGYPGLSLGLAVVAASWYLQRQAAKHKWDVFEILDLWAIALAVGLGGWHVGYFFSGEGVGHLTNLPWGLIFPGQLEPHHPAQLYTAGFFFSLAAYLWWAEYHYRTFAWYRRGKKTAQTGFLISTLALFSGLFLLIRTLIQPASAVVWGVELDGWLYTVLAVVGLILLLRRSGRLQWHWPKKAAKASL